VVNEMTEPVDGHDRSARLVEYRSRVYRHLLAMTRDPAQADDLTQETFLRAVSRIDQLRDESAALGWLYKIATNVMIDHARRPRLAGASADIGRCAETGTAEPIWQAPVAPPQTAAERAEMSECVDLRLAALPDDFRVVLLLHDGHGLTNPEIADLLQCSLPNVKIRVHRARSRLRATLVDACDFSADDRGELVCEQR